MTTSDVDPEDFLRDVLKISPEDAAKVREDAAAIMEREDRQRVKDAENEPSDAPTDDPLRPSNPA